MYELWIILFCLLRSIITRFFFKKKNQTTAQSQQSSEKKEKNPEPKVQQTNATLSPLEQQLKQLKERKSEIESTMQQFNNPSTFAKYSKMQRQLSKLNNQIPNIEAQIAKQNEQKSKEKVETKKDEPASSLLQQRKKQIQSVHSQIGNKDLLLKAFINLALIIMCSYTQSSEISSCASYPLYIFCNQSGTINGAWIFAFSSIIFSY